MQLAAAVARIVRRTASWDTVGFAVSLALVAAACFMLYRLLGDVDVGKIAAALRAIPPRAVITAFLLIAASYFCLTFYDFFALRTIGHTHIPYRIAALTGFHELHDRAQYRRDGLHRRRGSIPDVSSLGPGRDRRRQGGLRHRPHLLARQRRRARRRYRLRAGRRGCDQPASRLDQPRDRARRCSPPSRST